MEFFFIVFGDIFVLLILLALVLKRHVTIMDQQIARVNPICIRKPVIRRDIVTLFGNKPAILIITSVSFIYAIFVTLLINSVLIK